MAMLAEVLANRLIDRLREQTDSRGLVALSARTVAAEAGVSYGTALKAINMLIDDGELKRLYQRGQRGDEKETVYKVLPAPELEISPCSSSDSAE